MANQGSGGGAATAGGMDFQHRIAAWIAVTILAEKGTTVPWELGSSSTLEAISCERPLPVDDILASTSQGGLVLVNVKRSLSLSRQPDSELASVIGQFVRQFLDFKNGTSQFPDFNRSMEESRDRLILATGPHSSAKIRVHLSQILERLRRPGPTIDLANIHHNDDEKETLKAVVELIRNAWVASGASEPINDEIIELLRLIYVQEMDIEAEGHTEIQARNTLRTIILQDPDQADGAWGCLISVCSGLAKNRAGADRSTLQRLLNDKKFPQKATFSYRPDIERLRQHSKQTLSSLKPYSEIAVQNQTVKVIRDCQSAFLSAALDRSVLVVGEPGAGKSGAVHDFVQSLEDGKKDLIFLAVDRLSSESLGELRQELGLQNELFDVIDHWPGTAPVLLVIDALDAARVDPKMKLYRDLIRRVMTRNANWRVVASIRKFDLRNSKELQQIFNGAPVTGFSDPEFSHVQHLNVGQLTDIELGQIGAQSQELYQLVQIASLELQKLIRTVFNLRLLAELLDSGAAPSDLTPIRTQIELLEKYWSYRVIGEDGNGYAREGLLADIGRVMVDTRTLRVALRQLPTQVDSRSLYELLSNHVLIQWQAASAVTPNRNMLVFAHNILFDYAVSRLLLSDEPETLLNYFASDPDLFLIIRPSISLHLQHLWINEPVHHDAFWREALLLSLDERIPEIGKLIAPSVVVDLACVINDLQTFLYSLTSDDADQRKSAEVTLTHLVGSLLARPNEDLLVGSEADPWSELAVHVSQALTTATIFPLARLLMSACEHFTDFTLEQRARFGLAARRLLEFAWNQPSPHNWLVIQGIKAVSRTFASDPTGSATLLRRAIETEHLEQYGHQELSWLGREVGKIFAYDPHLVSEIYMASFGFQDISEEKTAIGASQIFSPSSTRRQDYRMGRWQLSEAYPQFLTQAPTQAIESLIDVLEAYVENERASGDQAVQRFDFNGQAARIQMDRSSTWDSGNTYRHDEHIKMLDAFTAYVKDLTGKDDTQERIQAIIDILVKKNKMAVLWRRLLLLGAEFPEKLGIRLAPLARALPILKGYDSSREVGAFLKTVFSRLPSQDREQIEQAILSIPQTVSPERLGSAEQVRNRLLGCLNLEDIVTPEARTLLSELQAAKDVPANILREGIVVTSRRYEQEDYLRGVGVPVDEEPNRRIRDLEAPVKEFVEKYRNTVPNSGDAESIMPALKELCQALKNAEVDGVHPTLSEHGWGELGAACVLIARMEDIDCEDETGRFIRDLLLELSTNPEPIYRPESDEHFDESPSWSQAPRIKAAQGLILLARKECCADETVLRAIDQLSQDDVPAVRLEIAHRLRFLYTTAKDLMWDIVERMSRTDPSRGVLQFLLGDTLSALSEADIEGVVDLTLTIYNRITDGPGSRKVRNGCLDVFNGLYLWKNNARCSSLVKALAVQPDQYDDVQELLRHFSAALTCGLDKLDDTDAKAVRRRAYELVESILDTLLTSYEELEVLVQRTNTDLSAGERARAQSIVQLLDQVAREIYFSSGAFAEKNAQTSGAMRDKKAEQFYWESGALLDKLSAVAMPIVTHQILETLEFFIPSDSRGVLLRIGRVLESGKKGGYQFESLGAQLLVKIVERYLAEYIDLLQKDGECRQVILNALNIFVAWPEAQQLTYRLEDIFR